MDAYGGMDYDPKDEPTRSASGIDPYLTMSDPVTNSEFEANYTFGPDAEEDVDYDLIDESTCSVYGIGTNMTLSHPYDSILEGEVTDTSMEYSTPYPLGPVAENDHTGDPEFSVETDIYPSTSEPERQLETRVEQKGQAQTPERFYRDYICPARCRFKCSANLSRAEKETFFENFENIPTYKDKCLFICKFVKEEDKKQTSITKFFNKQKQFSRKYFINDVRVCKNTFIKTLQITGHNVNDSLRRGRNNNFTNMRGKHYRRWNRKPDNVVEAVIAHISKFPTEECQICKEQSTTRYVTKSVNEIYNLYKINCTAATKVSITYFRAIFEKYFNAKQQMRKQCNTCVN